MVVPEGLSGVEEFLDAFVSGRTVEAPIKAFLEKVYGVTISDLLEELNFVLPYFRKRLVPE